MSEKDQPGIYSAEVSAEEMNGEMITVEPDRYDAFSDITTPAGTGLSIVLPTYKANDILFLRAAFECAGSFTTPHLPGWNLHSAWSAGDKHDCAWWRRVGADEVVPNPQVPTPYEWSVSVIYADNLSTEGDLAESLNVLDCIDSGNH